MLSVSSVIVVHLANKLMIYVQLRTVIVLGSSWFIYSFRKQQEILQNNLVHRSPKLS